MSEPVIAGRAPVRVELEAGRRYWWCACGKSANQPFCDGSHRRGPYEPVEFRAESSGPAFLCACKRTQGRPFCDGSHKRLPPQAP